MSVEDRLRKARSALDEAGREQEEQRALRDRRVAQAREQASAGFRKEAAAAGRYAEHMAELTRRQQEAGGWATGKTLSDKSKVMGLGTHEGERAEKSAQHDVPTVAAEPDGAGGRKETRTPGTSASSPESPVATPVSPRTAGRHARDEHFDDDDFSNNTWMVD